jgi:conjugal transfer pilus assembly protein TraV
MNKKLIALMLAALPLFSGCASMLNTGNSDKFGCEGMPKGVVCKTPRQVYSMTNSGFNDIGTAGENNVSGIKKSGKVIDNQMASVVNNYDTNSGQLAPVPVLEQAKVLRIWVAPWVDKNKDLHWPGLIFTKVQVNTWNFGNDSFEGVDPPVPHRMLQGSEPIPPKKLEVEQTNKPAVNPADAVFGTNDETLN